MFDLSNYPLNDEETKEYSPACDFAPYLINLIYFFNTRIFHLLSYFRYLRNYSSNITYIGFNHLLSFHLLN